jgi:hypothetical protein
VKQKRPGEKRDKLGRCRFHLISEQDVTKRQTTMGFMIESAVAEFIEVMCLMGSILLVTWGGVRTIKIVLNKDWEDHTAFKLILPLVGIFATAALLYFVWAVRFLEPRFV